MIPNITNVPLPAELVERLTREAKERGMSVPTYIEHLRLVQTGRIRASVQSAARFMLRKHADSLRKLAQ